MRGDKSRAPSRTSPQRRRRSAPATYGRVPRFYWNLKNVTEMFYGIPVRVLSVASWFHWSGMLLVSYYDHSGSKNAAGRYPMTHT